MLSENKKPAVYKINGKVAKASGVKKLLTGRVYLHIRD